MSSAGSVTRWLQQLQGGDREAAQKLWERYFHRLVALARARLARYPCKLSDEEDVALSAFDSFCRGVEGGRFPQLFDRDNLWRLLVTITARKSIDQAQHERRLKRGGGLANEGAAVGAIDLDQLIGQEPTPAFAAQAAEECSRLLDLLGTPELRSVAVWKMEGFTAEEIAEKLNCVVRTVERKLWVIRNLWAKELGP